MCSSAKSYLECRDDIRIHYWEPFRLHSSEASARNRTFVIRRFSPNLTKSCSNSIFEFSMCFSTHDKFQQHLEMECLDNCHLIAIPFKSGNMIHLGSML